VSNSGDIHLSAVTAADLPQPERCARELIQLILVLPAFPAGAKIRGNGRRVKAGGAIAQRRRKGGLEAVAASETIPQRGRRLP